MTEAQNSPKAPWALAAELAERMGAYIDSIKDELSPRAQEAYGVLIRLCGLLGDPSNMDKAIKEGILAEISIEKMEWAGKVLTEWGSEQERLLEIVPQYFDSSVN